MRTLTLRQATLSSRLRDIRNVVETAYNRVVASGSKLATKIVNKTTIEVVDEATGESIKVAPKSAIRVSIAIVGTIVIVIIGIIGLLAELALNLLGKALTGIVILFILQAYGFDGTKSVIVWLEALGGYYA